MYNMWYTPILIYIGVGILWFIYIGFEAMFKKQNKEYLQSLINVSHLKAGPITKVVVALTLIGFFLLTSILFWLPSIFSRVRRRMKVGE